MSDCGFNNEYQELADRMDSINTNAEKAGVKEGYQKALREVLGWMEEEQKALGYHWASMSVSKHQGTLVEAWLNLKERTHRAAGEQAGNPGELKGGG